MQKEGVAEIVIIGSGNVASHLALRLKDAENTHVAQVYSPTLAHAEDLANKLPDCQAVSSVDDIKRDANFYLISLTDSAVPSFAAQMPEVDGIVAHTSGSVPMSVLGSERAGVLYPLQTFTKEAQLVMTDVPFFIEATDEATLHALIALARLIAPNRQPQLADSRQRQTIHLAAVFASNFANNLWAIAEKILAKEEYPLDVLMPLIQATLDKAKTISPVAGQTGPAIRHNQEIIDKHIDMLSGDPALQRIYIDLTQNIQRYEQH